MIIYLDDTGTHQQIVTLPSGLVVRVYTDNGDSQRTYEER